MSRPYDEFLRSKHPDARPAGFEPTEPVNPQLFGFQADIVRWALRLGKAAIFSGCGTGKSFMQLEWARHVCGHTGGKVLILAPLAVGPQTRAEGAKLGTGVTVCRTQADVLPGVNVANYEMLKHFDPSQFAGVVLDECFAPGTKVDVLTFAAVLDGTFETVETNIEDVQRGDTVLNASGFDFVSDVHRREVPYAVRLSYSGRSVTCSPNHPFFTQRGWVGAQDLEPGDRLLTSTEAVRVVRDGLPAEVAGSRSRTVLRSILLSEMADEPAGDHRQGPFPGSGGETWEEAFGLVALGRPAGRRRSGGDAVAGVPAAQRGDEGPHLPPVEGGRPQTFRAWGQWHGVDDSPGNLAGCSWHWLDGGVCLITGPAEGGVSLALQARHRQRQSESRYRGGWELSLRQEGPGPQEGRDAGFTRLDGLEVLEPGHPDLERLRSADGKLYFYDLGCTRHPSFSVNGHLVHNSSILKSFAGATKRAILAAFRSTPFKLACTATPAPNDHMELGNHADFLDVLASNEMLARWFINDTMAAGKYRLKGHAAADFWAWVASWAVSLTRPSDLGYPDDGFELPPLDVVAEVVEVDMAGSDGMLFRMPELSATSLHTEMRLTAAARAARVAALVNGNDRTWLVWCNTDYEADALAAVIPDAVDLRGSESPGQKVRKVEDFLAGKTRVLVSKPRLAGFGLNFQHCADMAFVGLSYSYEQMYQAVRRCWRFGQARPVQVHVVLAETEGPVLQALQAKERDHELMTRSMVAAMAATGLRAGTAGRSLAPVREDSAAGHNWRLFMGDNCKVVKLDLGTETVGLTVSSLPFENLYIYSDVEADMGNSADGAEFFAHLGYLIPELFRVTIPGRLCVMHCKDLPLYKNRDEVAGLRDFPGEVIRAFEKGGWTFHSRVTVWKDPVTEQQRTNNHGLLYKVLCTDSSASRQGMADYLVVFRKPAPKLCGPDPVRGSNPERFDRYVGLNPPDAMRVVEACRSFDERTLNFRSDVVVTPDPQTGRWPNRNPFPPGSEEYRVWSIHAWQRYASPVWFDIDQMDVLQYRQSRDEGDERHICPLQLDVIERCIHLWSNPGDVVLDPFAGIGSVPTVALKLGRKAIAVELKPSYFRQSVRNLKAAETELAAPDLFAAETALSETA